MYELYLVCAGVGGALVLCQFFAGLLGFGSEHGDFSDHGGFGEHEHADHGSGHWFFGLLTFRAISSAVLFFGLGGLSASYYNLPSSAQLATAALAGLGALYAVASLMKLLHGLRSDGTVRLNRAVGHTGTVYLRVPAGNSGPGKVTLTIQNRTVELEAFTLAAELPTGTPVRVVAIRGPGSVEVSATLSEA